MLSTADKVVKVAIQDSRTSRYHPEMNATRKNAIVMMALPQKVPTALLITQRSVLRVTVVFICQMTLVLKNNALARMDEAQKVVSAKPTTPKNVAYAVPGTIFLPTLASKGNVLAPTVTELLEPHVLLIKRRNVKPVQMASIYPTLTV